MYTNTNKHMHTYIHTFFLSHFYDFTLGKMLPATDAQQVCGCPWGLWEVGHGGCFGKGFLLMLLLCEGPREIS